MVMGEGEGWERSGGKVVMGEEWRGSGDGRGMGGGGGGGG